MKTARGIDPLLLTALLIIASLMWLRLHAYQALPAGDYANAVSTTVIKADASTLSNPAMGATGQDPFWPEVTADVTERSTAAPPVAAPEIMVAAAPPPPPPKPELSYRYFGRMKNPAGNEVIFAAREGDIQALHPGVVLGEFRLKRIEDHRAIFEHVQSGDTVEMSLPARQSDSAKGEAG